MLSRTLKTAEQVPVQQACVCDQAILSESLQQRAEAVLPSLCEVQERLLGTR